MKKVTIRVPKTDKDKWLFFKGSGGHPLKKRTASYTFLALERFLLRSLALKKADKLSVRVVYPDRENNETTTSKDAFYLIYATSCFLEDYLPDNIMRRVERKYL